MFKGLRKKIKALKILSKKTKDQEARELISDIIAFYKDYWKNRRESDQRKNELLNSVAFRILELFYKFDINLFKHMEWMEKQKEYKNQVKIYREIKGNILIGQRL
jgi:hypothetical protein